MSSIQELRYAGRRLRRSPAFTVVATLSIAIGIGGTATIFSLADALLLRRLPGVEAQDRLVNLHATALDGTLEGFSTPNFRDLLAADTGLAGITGFADRGVSLSSGGEAELVLSQVVTGGYFEVLGVEPALGRVFTAAEDDGGGEPVVVMSHALWHRRFAADPGVVGRKVQLNGRPFTVIGVGPERFGGTFIGFAFDLWIPASMARVADPEIDLEDRSQGWMELIGRLPPGGSIPQAATRLEAASGRLEEAYPVANEDLEIAVTPMTGYDEGLRAGVLAFLAILATVTLLVLVMACVNVANMLLARAADRHKEVAVRLALGASRGQVIRQLLAESLLLGLLGGAAGLLVTLWGIRWVRSFEPPISIPFVFHVELDLRVVAFAVALSALVGIAFGLLPALQSSRPQLVPALKETLTPGAGRSWLRRAFVVAQVSVSLLLLICTGLFLRTLQHAANAELGFEPERVQTVTLDPRILGFEAADSVAFFEQLTQRLGGLPGVQTVSLTDRVPLGVGALLGRQPLGINVPGQEPPAGQSAFAVEHARVGPGYFEVMGIPLLAGRGVERTDREDTLPVAVVNQELAARFWPGESAVGRQVVREDGTVLTVVGVTRTGKYRFPGEDPLPFLYLPYEQAPTVRATLLLATAGAPGQVAPDLRREIRAVAPDLPILGLQPLSEAIAIAVLPQRMAAAIAGVLGVIGLALAALGIYGVVAHSVSRRVRELGVRLSLGARHGDLLRMVVRDGMVLAAVGVGIGTALALLTARFLESLLFGIDTLDPLTFVATPLLLVLIALLASYLPARRVTAISPNVAARTE